MIQHVKNKCQSYTVEFDAISYILLLLYLTTKLYLYSCAYDMYKHAYVFISYVDLYIYMYMSF